MFLTSQLRLLENKMRNVGDAGIWRLYRVNQDNHEKPEQSLIGVFAILNNMLFILEDHTGLVSDTFRKGPVTDKVRMKMVQLMHSPYFRLVHEDDINDGLHSDLIPEAV